MWLDVYSTIYHVLSSHLAFGPQFPKSTTNPRPDVSDMKRRRKKMPACRIGQWVRRTEAFTWISPKVWILKSKNTAKTDINGKRIKGSPFRLTETNSNPSIFGRITLTKLPSVSIFDGFPPLVTYHSPPILSFLCPTDMLSWTWSSLSFATFLRFHGASTCPP